MEGHKGFDCCSACFFTHSHEIELPFHIVGEPLFFNAWLFWVVSANMHTWYSKQPCFLLFQVDDSKLYMTKMVVSPFPSIQMWLFRVSGAIELPKQTYSSSPFAITTLHLKKIYIVYIDYRDYVNPQSSPRISKSLEKRIGLSLGVL